MTRPILEEVPTQDKFGREVEPGTKVGFMTVSTGSIGFGQGTYEGMVAGRARILEDYLTWTNHHPETGEDLTDYDAYNKYIESKLGPQPPYPDWRYNGSDREQKMQDYRLWSEKSRQYRMTLVKVPHPAKRRRVLINNVIFKL